MIKEEEEEEAGVKFRGLTVQNNLGFQGLESK